MSVLSYPVDQLQQIVFDMSYKRIGAQTTFHLFWAGLVLWQNIGGVWCVIDNNALIQVNKC